MKYLTTLRGLPSSLRQIITINSIIKSFSTMRRRILSLTVALKAITAPSIAFQTGRSSPPRPRIFLSYSNWDAFETRDSLELMVGGSRYEMVELPDSMMSTTLWVGNLCEFVTDEMLGEIFQQASSLKSVPACVARKPNMESLRYGFVTFRSEEEKEVSKSKMEHAMVQNYHCPSHFTCSPP